MQDIQLDENKRTQLDSNIKKMLEGGATQDDVIKYASDFKSQFGQKKNSLSSQSLDTQSPLPLQKPSSLIPSPQPFLGNEIQQGSIKEAALADKKKNESYVGAMWNNVVGSVARLAGGAARLANVSNTSPYAMMERSLLENASKITVKNLVAAKEKEIADAAKGFVEKARTSASSKEYEKSISEGFDVTNGIGISDLKAVGQMIPQFIADMGLAVGTGGGSFAIQGYDDALSMVDEIPEGKNISEGTRIAFGLGGALVVGALEKLGLDNIIKNPSVKKYVTAKIIKEATDEFVKKGVKVSAEQFEKAVINKASKLTAKELTKIVATRTVKSAAIEGGTESVQEGGMDLLKLAANELENKEIFNVDEIKDTAAKRYLNAFAAGGVLGGIGSSVIARVQNTQNAIKSKLEKVQTVEDIDAIVGEINDSVAEGVMTQEEAETVLPIVQNFIEVSSKLPESLNGKNKVIAVDLINERQKLEEELIAKEEQKKLVDVAFHKPLDEANKELVKRMEEINNELGELAKGKPEEISQPIELEIDETKEGNILQPTETKEPIVKEVIENIKPTEEGEEITVYHGGNLDSEGNLYLASDKKQADAYAQGNKGKVYEFKINPKKIASEDLVRNLIKELGLNSKEEGWDINELGIHELLDDRFSTSLKGIDKLEFKLKEMGYDGISFLDEDLLGKNKLGVNNYLFFNSKELLKQKEQPKQEIVETPKAEKPIVTVPIKVADKTIDVEFVADYKGKKVVRIDGNIHVYDPKNETVFNVPLDDSNGQRKINEKANNLESAKEYIDWSNEAKKENIKPIEIEQKQELTKEQKEAKDKTKPKLQKVELTESDFDYVSANEIAKNERAYNRYEKNMEALEKLIDCIWT